MRGAARKGGPYREGTFPDDAPARLADMAAVEAIAKGRVPPTHGERLQRIAEALKERRTQFERVTHWSGPRFFGLTPKRKA